jgi:hypothetical protein
MTLVIPPASRPGTRLVHRIVVPNLTPSLACSCSGLAAEPS